MPRTKKKMPRTASELLTITRDNTRRFIYVNSFEDLIKFDKTKVASQPSSRKGLIKKEKTKVASQPSSRKGLIKEEETKVASQPSSREGLIEEEKTKVASQPSFPRGLIKEENQNELVTSQPKTPPEAGVEQPTTLPEKKLVVRKAQVALEKNLEEMNRHEQNLLILKKFIKIVPEKEGGTERVFFSTSFPLSSDFKEVAKRVKRMAIRLAKITLRDWMLTWEDLEVELKKDDYDAFKKTIFKSFAKFILSIYDTEDLERFCSYNQLDVEYKKFYSEKILPIKLDENPYKLIAEGNIKFDGFTSLVEHDVASIISMYHLLYCKRERRPALSYCPVGARLMDFGSNFYDDACFKEKNHRHFREIARTVMLHFVPVKEDVKIRTFLDFIVCSRSSTLDAFLLEALADVGIQKLERHLTSPDLLERVALRIGQCLFFLNDRRHQFLFKTSFSVTYGVKYGQYGSFADEVIDLVNIADARRRFQGHRYISNHHILWAVGLTGIKDLVDKLVEAIGLSKLVEERATYPQHRVYMSARATADIHGDEDAGIEHLVVAAIFEMNKGRLRINLDVFNKRKSVTKFLDAVRDYKRKSDTKLTHLLNYGQVEMANDSLAQLRSVCWK